MRWVERSRDGTSFWNLKVYSTLLKTIQVHNADSIKQEGYCRFGNNSGYELRPLRLIAVFVTMTEQAVSYFILHGASFAEC